MSDGAFIGQLQTSPSERVEIWLRKIGTSRKLVFTVIDSFASQPNRGAGGLILDVSQIPELQNMIVNAHSRALVDGPISRQVVL